MLIFYTHLFLCIAVTAILWFMQVVHYPLLSYTDVSKWVAFSEKRRMATIMVTYPLMAFEALTGFALLLIATQSKSYPILAISLVMLLCLNVYTFMYLNPSLKKIAGPEDTKNQQKFLQLHLVRAIGWSIRILLLILVISTSA